MSAVVVVDPMASHRKDCGPMDGMSVPEPLEHSVVGVPLDVGDRVAVPNPIEHLGVSKPADSLSAMSVPEPLEHSVLGVPLEVGDGSVGRVAVPNPLEHSGVSGPADLPSASHPMIHTEVSSLEDGEVIVVGAVGSAAPLFLTG